MMDKSLWSIFEAVRQVDILSPNVVVFLLQLFAWAKLSEEKKIPDEIRILNIDTEILNDKRKIELIFDQLKNLPGLGHNSEAFQRFNNLGDIKESPELQTTIIEIRDACRKKLIKYDDVINSSLDLYDSYYLPDEIADLMIQIVQPLKKESIYCPFESSLKIAIKVASKTDQVFIESKRLSVIPYILNILLDINLLPKFNDPIIDPGWARDGKLTKFDIAISVPPFGVRYKDEIKDWYGRFDVKSYYGDIYHMQHILSHIEDRAIVLVSQAALFREAAGEKLFREKMINDGLIEAIISMPTPFLHKTSILSTLVVLKKNRKTKDIFLMDLSSDRYWESATRFKKKIKNIEEITNIYQHKKETDYSRLVKYDEIKNNEYSLSVRRYVIPGKNNLFQDKLKKIHLRLGEIAKIIRPQYVKSKNNIEDELYCEVSIGGIPKTGYINQPEKRVNVSSNKINSAREQLLQPLDILISVKGTIGKIGIVPQEIDSPWLANQSCLIIRVLDKEMMLPESLYMYLRSPFAQDVFKAYTSGSVIPNLTSKSIKEFPVINPSVEDQHKIKDAFYKQIKLQTKIKDLENEIESLNSSDYWELDKGTKS